MDTPGGQRRASVPRVKVVSDQNGALGIVGAHVDNFLITGGGGGRWREVEQRPRQAPRWEPREECSFKRTRRSMGQDVVGQIMIHRKLVGNAPETGIPEEWRKHRGEKLKVREMALPRGAPSEIQTQTPRVATQTPPRYPAQRTIYQSSGPRTDCWVSTR